MADNKERSRADEIFDVLNSLDDTTMPSDEETADNTSEETRSRADEIAEILSSSGNTTIPSDVEENVEGIVEENTEESVEENIDNAPEEARSHADEIFDVLSSLNDTTIPSDVEETVIDGTYETNEPSVDEILGMFSADTPATEEATEENPFFESEESEIPVAIFSHLSEESDVSQVSSVVENTPHFTDHLSSEEEAQASLQEEEDNEEDLETESKTGSAIKSVFRQLSIIPKAIIYILLVVIASAYLSYYIITIGNDVFALVDDNREVTLTIEDGATHESVAALLKEKGVIEYDWVYELYMQYRGDGDSSNEYIPGEYTLNTNYNYSQIINKLTSTVVKREVVTVTIPEGFTIDQIIDLLVEKGVGQREGYIEAINNYPYKWAFVQLLDEKGYSQHRKYRLEGYLYPDTYDFYTTESEVLVINKMLGAFNDKFWKNFTAKNIKGESLQKNMLDKYGMDFDDVVILASMVQSEGGTVDDFYAISYVFHNRLSHPASFPKLESDATIQYVLPERISDSTQLDPNYQSPYNTYLYNGLPPGAISSPGLDALTATVFPAAPTTESGGTIDAYFFVSNNAGKTYYASSKAGHQNNVAQAKKDNEAIEAGTYGK